MTTDKIRLGTPPGGQDGDDARTAFTRINSNFSLLDQIGLTSDIVRTTNDFNLATQPGWYLDPSNTAANKPPGLAFAVVFVSRLVSGYVQQSATSITTGASSNRIFNPNTGQWSVWDPGIKGSDLTSSSLDATPGKVTKNGDHGLGLTVATTDVLASISATRFYTATGVGTTDAPIAPNQGTAQGYGHHYQHPNPDFAAQEYTHLFSNRKFMRRKQAGVYTPWDEFVFRRDFVGLVSQVSGSPSGAIVERGSSSSGSYTKLADGTAFAFLNIADYAMAVPANDALVSGPFNFPMTFTGSATTMIGGYPTNGPGGTLAAFIQDASFGSSTLWRFTVVNRGATPVTRVAGLALFAIGRWF